MNATWRAICALLIGICLVTMGNFFLSMAGRPLAEHAAIPAWVRALSQLGRWPLTAIGVGLHAAFFGIWVWALTQIPLSIAVPMTALVPVLSALAGYYFLREPASAVLWAGITLVCIGVALVGWSANGTSR